MRKRTESKDQTTKGMIMKRRKEDVISKKY